jgi:hypothetical protein
MCMHDEVGQVLVYEGTMLHAAFRLISVFLLLPN